MIAAVPNVQQPNVQRPLVLPAAEPAAVRGTPSLSIKIWRAVSVIFEALAITGAIVIWGAVFTSSISIVHLITVCVLATLASRAAAMREKLHDFEDPQELQKLRTTASHMSYRELKRQFNWADVRQYNLLPIDGRNGLRHKILLYLASPENFTLMQGFLWGTNRETEELLEHGIIDLDIAQAIRGGNQARIQQLLAAQ